MMGPLAASGIHIPSFHLTKRQLKEWEKEKTPHLVCLYTLGGIFTSKGDGVYTSQTKAFTSTEAFWQFARDYRQGATMVEQ